MKYHIITLGCQMNVSDSERVKAVLDDKMGYTWTDNEEEAQLVGVIACSVRQKAINKVYSYISKWNKQKNHRHLITFLTGCILPYDKEQFLKKFDIVFNMADLPKFPEMISQYGITSPASLNLTEGKVPESIKDFWHITPHYSSDWQGFIPIQNGCDKFCTFCAVPYTRGREISRPHEEILDELKAQVNKGYKSITLLGQNVNSYGFDKRGNEISFAELLRRVGEYGKQSGKDFWVYFTSPHPRDFTDEVVEVIAEYPHIAKQIHLPVQSGDDKVLIRMNRKHNIDKYRHIIHKIWELVPDATIFTDIIVGFTGETKEQFENTRKIMEEFKFNMAYIAQYSPRPGAASSRWPDDVPDEVKKERFHELTNELTKHTIVHNKAMIGNTYKVLVTGKNKKEGYLSALTEGKIIVRFPSNDEKLIGDFTYVKITSVTPFATEGKHVNVDEKELAEKV
ncbi:MAG: tRNA (N6-isopentenyl adenosine(37)-C2)-methylthiotransferase MiaB [Bacteroidales bacterium]|nr:tRNA (N6-isopentenyl adenosine(37)-C2)-methylthiotransferase MiaB [Bacteroidales bacterium]MCF8333066.1 tRNA (N6-isopentenyl adenosine(37)-C2)-methylthiotransferase MiaB [Bacteroidales bacterium]